jgi:hypothetical protein
VSRFFHLDEARALLPRVEKVIRSAVQAKTNHEQCEQALQNLMQRIMIMGGILVDRLAVENMKSVNESSTERLKAALEEMGEIGCVVKDLDAGLVDFPTLFQGEEVYLCWRMDEPDIQFWHGVHEGFAGRRPIDKHFLDNHQGREPN